MANMKDSAFFHRDGDWLVGNDSVRGPWSEHHCHAGPVAAIVAGAAEKAVPDKQLVRVTASFFRPVPMSGVAVYAYPHHDNTRAGRKQFMTGTTRWLSLRFGGIVVPEQ